MIKDFNTQQVIRVLCRRPTTKFSMRELAKMAGISAPTASIAIKILEKNGLLKIDYVGKTAQVAANIENPAFRDLKRAYNFYSIIELKNFIIEEFNHPKAVVVFGSYSKGEDMEKSDIDIAIISKNEKHPPKKEPSSNPLCLPDASKT